MTVRNSDGKYFLPAHEHLGSVVDRGSLLRIGLEKRLDNPRWLKPKAL
jgi:hypothetical protein